MAENCRGTSLSGALASVVNRMEQRGISTYRITMHSLINIFSAASAESN
jgi:hypothetical protein